MDILKHSVPTAFTDVLVDFSTLTNAEIKDYFAAHSNQRTCGRFLTSQVGRPLTLTAPTTFGKFSNWQNQVPIARTVLLLLTSISMWVSGCIKNNDMTTGESIDTTANNTKPIMVDTTIKTITEPKDTTALSPHVPINAYVNQTHRVGLD